MEQLQLFQGFCYDYQRLVVDAAVKILMPERVDFKLYYEERLYVLAGEQDRQDWNLHKARKTQEEAKKLLDARLRDLLRPPPEHSAGDAASPVSRIRATVFKLVCKCPAECACRRPAGSCPSASARKGRYLLHIDNVEQVSLRPSTTWFPPGGVVVLSVATRRAWRRGHSAGASRRGSGG